MEASALSAAEFAEFGKKAVLFCHVTSRVDADKYQNLLSERGGQGFPYLAYLDADGALIGAPKGRDVAAFDAGLTDAAASAKAWADEVKKLSAGSNADKIELVIKRVDRGELKVEEAREALKPLGEMSSDQRAKFNGIVADGEVMRILSAVKPPTTPAEREKVVSELAGQFAAMEKDGLVPNKPANQMNFFGLMFETASQKKDLARMEAIQAAAKSKCDPKDRMIGSLLTFMQKRLDETRAAESQPATETKPSRKPGN